VADPANNTDRPEEEDRNRVPRVVVVARSQEATAVLRLLGQQKERTDVLLLSVGSSPGDFQSLPELLSWIRAFHEATEKAASVQLSFVALVPPTPTNSLEELRTNLRAKDELVHEHGAVLFDRTSSPGGFLDASALQSWLASRPVAFAPMYGWLRGGPSPTLQPPPANGTDESEDVKAVDLKRLQGGIDALNKAQRTDLDY
jgi:hypothetical protein